MRTAFERVLPQVLVIVSDSKLVSRRRGIDVHILRLFMIEEIAIFCIEISFLNKALGQTSAFQTDPTVFLMLAAKVFLAALAYCSSRSILTFSSSYGWM